ncbi:hypothetical protein JYG55_02865 [Escherichia fergusonii]|uniref:hypothetical protein n=1 Tax=Escherichia fergusonii TaxID=564 RepID=UPI001CBCDCAF|nr:hypothetical protein [Escherichia fergusonii]MBZ4135469.1 hypothetical protein [Escherichia fergusonii]MBZ4171577.1 hypothetical protein [Escherichia fergusonii]UAW40635.1 hypothetical protein JW961_08655 [Escherichia fergusonii]
MKQYYHDAFLLGLYALLTQIHLSVARGISAQSELRCWLRQKGTLGLIEQILCSARSKRHKQKIPLIKSLYYNLRGKNYLTESEWILLIKHLQFMRDFIVHGEVNEDALINARLEICYFSLKIWRRLNVNYLAKRLANHVEHFNESEYHAHFSVRQITSVITGWAVLKDNEIF